MRNSTHKHFMARWEFKYIQLFRERLSEKVHATMPKGIVGSSEFTVLQRNLKEWHETEFMYVRLGTKGKQQKYFRQLQCQEMSGTVRVY